MEDVRGRALEVLEDLDLDDAEDPVLRDGFAYEMLIAHEHQHNETMLQLLQMIDGYEPPLEAPAPGPVPDDGPETVLVDGGVVEIGADGDGFAYDNERPRHEVAIAPFRIDRRPVGNGDFAQFVADTGAEPPLYWERDGEGGWVSNAFGRPAELDPAAPVVHVDHWQASDFAAWAGKRLPTELEWEAAAAGSDPGGSNLDHASFRARPPAAGSESGCNALAMLGDVWEWTSSVLEGYPGFDPFPYPEYSEVFFGRGYPVMRGGSWATRRNVIRTSFRNWDLPERRQIFSGLRCVGEV
jgi:gamma-glutamyl hercynylcysteine S-oxide synthase